MDFKKEIYSCLCASGVHCGSMYEAGIFQKALLRVRYMKLIDFPYEDGAELLQVCWCEAPVLLFLFKENNNQC